MPLRKEDIERIEKEGDFYKAPVEYNNDESFAWSHGYISGATAEAEKANELVEALNELLNCDYTSGTHLYAAQHKATIALSNYKK